MILVNCETVGPKLLVIISSGDFLLHSCVPIAWLRRWFVVVKHLSTLATFSELVTVAQFSANPNLFPSWCWIHLPQPPPPTSLVNGIRKIDKCNSATSNYWHICRLLTFRVVPFTPCNSTFWMTWYWCSFGCTLPARLVGPAKWQDSYLKSRGFDSHPGLESWRSSWVRRLWHDFARSEFRIPCDGPCFVVFFGGDFRSVMIWPFLRYFFGGSPRPTLELVVKTHDESYGHTWRRCPKRRENGRGFGVSHVSQRLGVFFLFDGFTSGNEGLPGWKAFFGMDFWKHSTARWGRVPSIFSGTAQWCLLGSDPLHF